jgi:Rad3-related DNA helicase
MQKELKRKLDWNFYDKNNKKLDFHTWIGGNQKQCIEDILNGFNTVKIDKKEYDKEVNYREGSSSQILQLLDSKCGSGKSAIVLHVVKELGKGIIVVQTKSLQKQYRDDYCGINGNYILKNFNEKLKVGTMFGRGNFICRYMKERVERGEILINIEQTCNMPDLPCTKKEYDKAGNLIPRYITGSECPYFTGSPYPEYVIDNWSEKGRLDEIMQIYNCSDIKEYINVAGNKMHIFTRDSEDSGDSEDSVCDYYKQFYNYLPEYCDVIIMNTAKWKLETMMGRKPLVDVEIFDEFDLFCQDFSSAINISKRDIEKIFDIELFIKIVNNLDNEEKEMLSKAYRIGEDIRDIYIREKSDEINIKRQNLEQISKSKKIILDYFNFLLEKLDREMYDIDEDILLISYIKNLIDEVRKYDINSNNDTDEAIDNEEEYNEVINKVKYKCDIIEEFKGKYAISLEGKENNRFTKLHYNIPYPDLILKKYFSRSCNFLLGATATRLSEDTEKELYGLYYDKVIYGRMEQVGDLRFLYANEITKTGNKYEMIERVTSNYFSENPGSYDAQLIYLVLKLNKYGNTLVLTPGKVYVKGLRDYLRKVGYKYKWDFSEEEEYSGDKGNLVTISQRMHRGADLSDDKCRVLIWSKFPYPVRDGYIRALEKRFGHAKINRIKEDIAEQELIQGSSRGIRHWKDYCYLATPCQYTYDILKWWWNEQLTLKNRRYPGEEIELRERLKGINTGNKIE